MVASLLELSNNMRYIVDGDGRATNLLVRALVDRDGVTIDAAEEWAEIAIFNWLNDDNPLYSLSDMLRDDLELGQHLLPSLKELVVEYTYVEIEDP